MWVGSRYFRRFAPLAESTAEEFVLPMDTSLIKADILAELTADDVDTETLALIFGDALEASPSSPANSSAFLGWRGAYSRTERTFHS